MGQELIGVPTDEVCHPLVDDQKLYQAYLENPILKQQIEVYKQKLDLKDQELAIKDQMIALEEKRSEVYKSAYEMMKELLDQALKLSKKGPWDQILEWVIRIALFAAGVFIAK